MKFWQAVALSEPDQYCQLAITAEKLGFTGVTVGDHLVTPGQSACDSNHPYSDKAISWPWHPEAPFPDPWQMISAMAVSTSTLEFMTAIYILPLRDVFSAAKSISTAAVMSNNRVTLGVGVGWMEDEFILTGQNFRNRGARSQEMLDIIKQLMAGRMVEHRGKYYEFPPVQLAPVPSRPVPVIVGGDSEAALKRAAKADGWMSGLDDVAMIPTLVAKIREYRDRDGLDRQPFEIIAVLQAGPDLDTCLRLRDLGVTAVVRNTWYSMDKPNSPLAYKQSSMEDFAEQVISRFR